MPVVWGWPPKPPITWYHATINTGDSDGVLKRVSVEAKNREDALEKFAAEYGRENVVRCWGEWEAEQPRGCPA